MLSIAICDDEQSHLTKIRDMVINIMPDDNYSIAEFLTGEELIAAPDFDIVLLDILLPGANGIAVGEALRTKGSDCTIIYITRSADYVFAAFDVRAFNYLLKPLSKSKFKTVLLDAVALHYGKDGGTITVKKGWESIRIKTSDIIYIEVYNRTSFIHIKNNVIECLKQLSEFETELTGKGFFRCHKSFLVNLSHVKSHGKGAISFTDIPDTVPLSKAKTDDLRALLSNI